MGSCYYSEDELFFDSREEITSASDRASASSEDCSSSPDSDNTVLNSLMYDVWVNNLESVHDRRRRFLTWMGLGLDRDSIDGEERNDESSGISGMGVDRITDNGGAVLRTSSFEDSFLSSQSSISSRSGEASGSFGHGSSEQNFLYRIKNLDDGREFVVDEVDQDGMLSRLREVGSNKSFSFEEFQRAVGTSGLVQQLLSRYVDGANGLVKTKRKLKRSWLKKLGSVFSDRHGAAASRLSDVESSVGGTTHRVKVHQSKKQTKELSSVYAGQEFLAHKGSILTMKFSLDGQYLASGGEDGILRVWKVIEDDRVDQFDIPTNDSSCLYFTMNHQSQLASLNVEKKQIDKTKKLGSSDSTCVIFPPKVFRVLEKPLHEFHGHSAEILGLSWSKKRFLLSSSADMTVRLWEVGLTCVDFNPVDDNYFISGSIDGKVRIWEVFGCKVVDYTDIREIVTAVCYRPDGKGGIVGSMTGNCLFYDIVASTLRTAPNQMFATFTSDGKHIISTSDDSNIYIWNYTSQEKTSSRVKKIQSSESFLSQNASIAIPWRGMETMPESILPPSSSGDVCGNGGENGHEHQKFYGEVDHKMIHSAPDCFSVARGFLLEALTRGSATWPEEKLPDSSPMQRSPTRYKPELKFLKSACQNMLSSHLWGLVIVTAGWDGRIRTYLNYGLPLRL
ncbi:hypothetical protein Tsubulata_001131 [Turnera subulata]|uniref:Uncharacterized protein n=1 Tax=Turnera subulata TaxID=218843 RepID=A0A9Q0G0I0_9ROSI|nr:hypothetical protein Tsubulata_001131 [Turnera subulata]